MSIGKIVRHFEGLGKVPVDIKDVLALVRSMVTTVEIRVRRVDVDLNKLKGNCYRYQIDDAAVLVPRQIAMIVYNKRLDPFDQRLVCCKELVHLVDPDPIMTSKKDQVVHLAENVIKKPKPAGVNIPLKDLQVFYDLLAKWHALAILFPFGLYEELKPKAVTLDYDKLSKEVELPREYVEFMMTDEWAAMRETILAYS